MVKHILSASELFSILRNRDDQSFTLQRNAIPHLLINASGITLQDSGQGKIGPGEYIVIQPSGSWHKTDPNLHAKDGEWNGHKFDHLNPISVEEVKPNSSTAVTSTTQIANAKKNLLEINSGVSENRLIQVGWAPSISQTRAYQIPPELSGAIIRQPWGDQIINPQIHVLVMVVGDTPDCYANPKVDMKDWAAIDRKIGLSGDELVSELPALEMQELSKLLSWQRVITKPSSDKSLM